MKVELFPFQKMALFQLRRKTAEALGSYRRWQNHHFGVSD